MNEQETFEVGQWVWCWDRRVILGDGWFRVVGVGMMLSNQSVLRGPKGDFDVWHPSRCTSNPVIPPKPKTKVK